MKNIAKILFLSLIFYCTFSHNIYSQSLVWSQEFNGASIGDDTWTYDFGTGCHEGVCGWGNSELQYYTSRADNVYTSAGSLVLEAKSETFASNSFTSGRINTEGRMHFKYGTLEARIQIPDLGNGLWPAFWLMGVTGGTWPAVGEIDVAEWGIASAITDNVVNKRVGGAVHWDYQGSYAGYGDHIDFPVDLNNGYHIYKLEWTPAAIKCFVDDVQYYEINISDIVANSMEEFHNMKYILLNLAVGGTYTGITSVGGITAPLPAQMQIDYIRLYQDSNGELWLGEDEAECGDYGVFTETTPVSEHIAYGTEANLYTWNGLTPSSRSAYEGSEVMSYNTTAGTWYGLGVNVEGRKNMSTFSGGAMNFRMRTNAPGTVRVGISTGHGESWVDLSSAYGYVANNTWQQISIPFSAFYDLDLGSVKQMIMITGDVPTSGFALDIDDVYYSGGGTCTTPSGLPSPWVTADVGNVAEDGTASYASGTFTLEGSGSDIWGTADEFRYVYQPVSGDVTITAQVLSIENTNPWAKAGVMIREDLTTGSQHAMTIIASTAGASFQRRVNTNGSSSHTTTGGISDPYWVRLVRSGDTFTSYRSADGSTWTLQGSQTISMDTDVYVGLVTTSHNDGTLCTATFSDVTVEEPTTSTGTGLSATYYNNMDFTGSTVTREDATIDFSWGSGSPDGSIGVNTFSARWTGSVQADQSGTYTFYTRTDDGVRLWVNGQQLVNKWVNQGPTEWSGTISLTAGVKVPIVMEYYENGGGAVAQLSWSASGVSKQIIPQTNLYPDGSTSTPSCTAGTNLAENETIVSFSAQENTTNGAANINDGSDANRWSANGFPQNVVIDLGDTYSVDEINLMPYLDRPYQFWVEGSTSSATSGFTTMTNATGNATGGSVINRSFSARDVRYVRLTVTGVSGNVSTWSSVEEFEVICSGNSSSRFAATTVQPPSLIYSPNPFGQKGLFIQVPAEMERLTSVRAVDMLGRIVFEQHGLNPGDEAFILQGVQTGLYLLQWMTESSEVLQTSKVLRQ